MWTFPETEFGIDPEPLVFVIDPEPPVFGSLTANQLKFVKFIPGQLV
jgi:hypothetical protein